jgi:hypothetical protein
MTMKWLSIKGFIEDPKLKVGDALRLERHNGERIIRENLIVAKIYAEGYVLAVATKTESLKENKSLLQYDLFGVESTS